MAPKTAAWVDAQAMHREHPDTFEAPSAEELAAIQPGMIVKVCPGQERFWVIVQTHVDDRLTGVVDNDLLYPEDHGLRLHDVVAFEERHIYAIYED